MAFIPLRTLKTLSILAALLWSCAQATAANDVLVSVAQQDITAADLEIALGSSPFATKFNALDESDQALLRGGLLQRLVASRLLLLEAQTQGLEDDPALRTELETFRLGMLHRRYMDKVRDDIQIPDAIRQQMKDRFASNHEAFKAAQSAYVADHYKQARIQAIRDLRERYHVRLYPERMQPDAAPETLLLEGDGIRIPYADLLALPDRKPTVEWMEHHLFIRAEMLLTALAAQDAGIDVEDDIASYRRERLPALLLERMQNQWLPNDAPLQAYFSNHPELGTLLERRHIGQLVVASRAEAQALRQRILAGESLFKLAGQYSIDPFGRSRNGDMGWIKADRGDPILNAAIEQLEDNQLSEVIETPLGFHLVTILERKPGAQRPFHRVRDKVRQAYLAERMNEYLRGLEQKYPVVWHIKDKASDTQG